LLPLVVLTGVTIAGKVAGIAGVFNGDSNL
jgi:hypothetical protein